MPVDTTHADYCKAAPSWQLMRDVLGGSRAVKERGTAYLPMLSDQTTAQYEGYKDRAQFFNITGKAADALIGFLFRKDPVSEFPATLAPVARDVTRTGVSWYDYVKTIAQEVVGVGRGGTLIDFDADKERRPYVVRYAAENVINWAVTRIGGRMMLSMVMLFEMDPVWIPMSDAEKKKGPPDKYTAALYPQWREYELRLDEAGEPYVVCTLWRKKEGKKEPEFVSIGQMNLERRGMPLSAIPFIFHNPQHSQPCPSNAPLEDMAEVNISHYQTSADHENICHTIGSPTPYVFGADLPANTLKLGTTACLIGPAEAKCGFLQLDAGGAPIVEKNLERKERQMAALGAKMLEPEAKKAEAYDTVAIRAAAETASLMGISLALSESLSGVLRWCAWWIDTKDSAPEDLEAVRVVLNSEFVAGTLKPEQLTALSTAYASNALSLEDYFFNLIRGEMVDPARTLKEFKASLEAGPVGMPAFEQAPPVAA